MSRTYSWSVPSGQAILPETSGTNDLGSANLPYRNVYALNLYGNENFVVSGTSTILNVLDTTVLSGTTISGDTINANIQVNTPEVFSSAGMLVESISDMYIESVNSIHIFPGNTNSNVGNLILEAGGHTGSNVEILSPGGVIQTSGDIEPFVSGANNVGTTALPYKGVSANTISGNQIFQSGTQVLDQVVGLGTISVVSTTGGVVTISGASTGTANAVISGSSTILNVLDVTVLSGTTISGNAIYENGIQVPNSLSVSNNLTGNLTAGAITISGSLNPTFTTVKAGLYTSTGDVYISGGSIGPISLGAVGGVQLNSNSNLYTQVSGQNNIGAAIAPFNTIYADNSVISHVENAHVVSGTTISGNQIYENGVLVATVTDISNVSGIAATAIQNATNLGTGIGLFSSKSGTNLQFNTISGTGAISAVLAGNVVTISTSAQPAGNYVVSGSSTILNVLDVTTLSGTTVNADTVNTKTLTASVEVFSPVISGTVISGNQIYSNGVLLQNYTLPSSITGLTLLASSVVSGTTISGNAFYLNGVPLTNYTLPSVINATVLSGTTVSGNAFYLNGVPLTNYTLPTTLNGMVLINSATLSGTTISGNTIYENGIQVPNSLNLTNMTGNLTAGVITLSGNTSGGTAITMPAVTTASGIAVFSGTSGKGFLNTPMIIDPSNGDMVMPGMADIWMGYTTNNPSILPSGLTYLGGYNNLLINEGYVNIFGTSGVGTTTQDATIDLENRGSGVDNYGELAISRSRGTVPTVSGVLTGDDIGHLGWWGSADISGNYINGAYIRALALENYNYLNGNGGTKIQFNAQNTGAAGVLTAIAELTANSGTGFIGTSAIPLGNLYSNALYSLGQQVPVFVSGLGTISVVSNTGGVLVISGSASSATITSPLNVSVVSGTTISGTNMVIGSQVFNASLVGTNTVMIGTNNDMGLGGVANATNSLGVGNTTTVSGSNSVAIGTNTTAQGNNLFVFGSQQTAYGSTNAMLMGNINSSPISLTNQAYFNFSNGIINASGSINTSTLSGTNVISDTITGKNITATTELYSPTVSGTTMTSDTVNGKNVTASVELFSPVVSGTTISGNTINSVLLNSATISGTVISGNTATITNINATTVSGVFYQPNGYPIPFQSPKLSVLFTPLAAATVQAIGGPLPTIAATLTEPAWAQPYGWTQNIATSTTSGNNAGFSATAQFAYTSGTQSTTQNTLNNGITFRTRFSTPDASYTGVSGCRIFIGLTSQATVLTVTQSDNPAGNYMGLQFCTASGSARQDTAFQLFTKDNTTQATGSMTIAPTNGHTYDFYMSLPNVANGVGAGTLSWLLQDKTAGTQASGTTQANLPLVNTALAPFMQVNTVPSGSAVAKALKWTSMYVESQA